MTSPPAKDRFLKHLAFKIGLIVCFILLTTDSSVTAGTRFARYAVIEDNISFWKKIYATYSLNQAVIHDSNDLSIIYEVIRLRNPKLAGATSHNSKLQKSARKKYAKILKKLSKQSPKTTEEKRVAGLFSGTNKKKQMAKAAENVRSQLGQRERFRQGVRISGAYMAEIKRIFRSYNLPEDLAYLPHVESSFNTRAYSKFGAAGIWQFTRATGKRYLTINYVLDERLDPILASHAAARYLKNSYASLGQWPLAVTSYNYGLSGMLRAKKALGTYPKIFKNYNKGHFKFASRNFYPEFLAALRIAKDLEKKLKLEGPQSNNMIKLKGFLPIDVAERHFKITKDSIKELNPALRAPVFAGEKFIPKGYSLRLPKSQNSSVLITSFPASLLERNQKASLYHRVKRGETAGSIARLHGVSLKKLIKNNNLDKNATIYVRQKLRIPRPSGASSTASITNLTSQKKNRYQQLATESTVPVLSESKKNKPDTPIAELLPAKDLTVYNVFNLKSLDNKPTGSIIVQPEETIRLYAEWLGTSRGAIEKLNSRSPTTPLSPGEKLIVPFSNSKPDKFEEKRLDFLQETEEDFFLVYTVISQKRYKVTKGDTLWDLCRNKFDIPLWLLERYNPELDLAKLRNGQELFIPVVKQL